MKGAFFVQEDFHFYTTYVLCRLAGMKHEPAYKISYSCQHVDDAIYGHVLDFENGGSFHQVTTAWEYGINNRRKIQQSLELLRSRRLQEQILVPFHFLPGNQTDSGRFRERMICRKDSPTANKMMDHIQKNSSLYQLQLFGIGLHIYSDTWVHQNFSGQFTGIHENINAARSPRDFKRFRNNGNGLLALKDEFFTEVGHGQVGEFPDEPYRKWSYYHCFFQKKITLKNWELFLEASSGVYKQILTFLEKPERKIWQEKESISWDDFSEKLSKSFRFRGTESERCKEWQRKISEGFFGFTEKDFQYEKRKWFHEAVRVSEIKNYFWKQSLLHTYVDWISYHGNNTYCYRENFGSSDWKYFHDGAAYLKYYILHELLSESGIYCGS